MVRIDGEAERSQIRTTFLACLVALVMVAAACGGATDVEEAPDAPAATTSTVVPTTVTTGAPPTTAGRTCASILSDGVTLARNFRNESRGVAGPPDERRFRASAQLLVDEAKRLGCPVPDAVQQFLR